MTMREEEEGRKRNLMSYRFIAKGVHEGNS
jgi:hypothetical protein